MATKKQSTPTQDKVAVLKQKQDKWMTERSQSLLSTPKSVKSNSAKSSSTSSKSQPVKAFQGRVQSKPEVLMWNTGTKMKDSAYSGFVVRKKKSGEETNRSQNSVKSHSSLRNKDKKRPTTAKSESNFVKSESTKIKENRYHDSLSKNEEQGTFDLKMEDYFSKLDLMDEKYDHTKYEFQTSRIGDNSSIDGSQLLSAKSVTNGTMSSNLSSIKMDNHVCRLCGEIMKEKSNSPQTVYPCGHSFCLTCLIGQKFCPECHCNIMSMELNASLWKVIQKYQDQLRYEELKKKELEARKYLDEYQSLKTRSKVMQDEASEIIDRMETITHELVSRRTHSHEIENTAVNIREQMKTLTEKLELLQKQHFEETHQIQSLEIEYDSYKQQLLMVEKTLKTIGKSRERVKLMVEHAAPGARIVEQLSD